MKSIKFDGKEIHPSKIVCVGRNYIDHINELNNEISHEPVIFIKPNSAISHQVYSSQTDLIHYESEMAFLIISCELKAVGFGLDLTKRDMQTNLKNKGLPWERAKAFDHSAVFSEFVSFNGNNNDLRLEFYINDELVQQGGCDLMMNKPDDLLAEAKTFLSFEDGDVLMTGTPKGVGPVKAGDIYRGNIFAQDKLIVEASWVVK